MPKKKYDKKNALGGPVDYRGVVDGLPEEMRPQMEQAMAVSLNVIHGNGQEPGIAEGILENIASAEDKGTAIASESLKVVDILSQQIQLEESVKLLLGFTITQEIVDLSNQILDTNVSGKETAKIYEAALTVFLHEQVMAKPTKEERNAEAIRIQKEVDPLIPPKLRDKGNETAQQMGIPTGNVQQDEDPYAKAEARRSE